MTQGRWFCLLTSIPESQILFDHPQASARSLFRTTGHRAMRVQWTMDDPPKGLGHRSIFGECERTEQIASPKPRLRQQLPGDPNQDILLVCLCQPLQLPSPSILYTSTTCPTHARGANINTAFLQHALLSRSPFYSSALPPGGKTGMTSTPMDNGVYSDTRTTCFWKGDSLRTKGPVTSSSNT